MISQDECENILRSSSVQATKVHQGKDHIIYMKDAGGPQSGRYVLFADKQDNVLQIDYDINNDSIWACFYESKPLQRMCGAELAERLYSDQRMIRVRDKRAWKQYTDAAQEKGLMLFGMGKITIPMALDTFIEKYGSNIPGVKEFQADADTYRSMRDMVQRQLDAEYDKLFMEEAEAETWEDGYSAWQPEDQEDEAMAYISEICERAEESECGITRAESLIPEVVDGLKKLRGYFQSKGVRYRKEEDIMDALEQMKEVLDSLGAGYEVLMADPGHGLQP
ncbi:hypothetical protein GF351_06125 [Candidatus Woesearchaeota archaeon]|nr:hypothetical protein [Candidatus Woesearchaeota archaeon]